MSQTYRKKCFINKTNKSSIPSSSVIYCSSVRGGGCKITLNPIFIAQKGAIRAIYGESRRTPTNFIFEESKPLRFSDVISFVTCNYVYSSLNNPSLNEFSYRQYSGLTRDATNQLLYVPNVRLECCRQGLLHRGPIIYNELPLEIRSNHNLN